MYSTAFQVKFVSRNCDVWDVNEFIDNSWEIYLHIIYGSFCLQRFNSPFWSCPFEYWNSTLVTRVSRLTLLSANIMLTPYTLSQVTNLPLPKLIFSPVASMWHVYPCNAPWICSFFRNCFLRKSTNFHEKSKHFATIHKRLYHRCLLFVPYSPHVII